MIANISTEFSQESETILCGKTIDRIYYLLSTNCREIREQSLLVLINLNEIYSANLRSFKFDLISYITEGRFLTKIDVFLGLLDFSTDAQIIALVFKYFSSFLEILENETQIISFVQQNITETFIF